MKLARIVLVCATLTLAGCHAGGHQGQSEVPGDSDSSRPFEGISEQETLHVVGTEPFWSGQAQGASLTYATPAKPEGTRITVRRFGGRNGLGLSGMLGDEALDMTVTPGTCSDGMSDRRFPFSVTLKIGSAVREGCGWTDSKPFTEAK
jgi:uncharacterized membrane protein